MTPLPLELVELRKEDRIIVALLRLGGERFEVRYFASSPPSITQRPNPLAWTREEFVLQRLVEQFHEGELLALPTPVIVPDELPPKALRRLPFFDTEDRKALLRRACLAA